MNDEQPATPQLVEPVAWRHNLTHCLYETAEEVQLADADSWAEPLYLGPPSTASSVRVCCQDFEKCRELCVPRASYWQGQTSQLRRELAATHQQPAAASAGATEKERMAFFHRVGKWPEQVHPSYFKGWLARAALQSPPAKARPTDDELWDQTLRERDNYEEWADKLAEGISRFIGFDIGEHSSANNPWARAIDMIPAGTLGAVLQSPPVATAQQSEAQTDLERDAFYQTIDAYERAAGHKAPSFDVWLLARGRMDTTGRRIATQPAPSEAQIKRLQAAIEGECDGLAVDAKHARAILEYVMGVAHPAAGEATERAGWKLVPIEPTEAMVDAGYEAIKEDHDRGVGNWGECGGHSWRESREAWKAMLDAVSGEATEQM